MKRDKRYYRRPKRPRSSLSRSTRDEKYWGRPRIDPELKPIFSKIGIPEPEPFKPDPFQIEALNLIKDYDVLVSAATGAGKTWIASQAINSYLSENLRVWYASPLKALSNSIYQEFCRDFGSAYCGILTGDRKENPEAPVIVGTTEILRNQLYDSMHEGISIRSDLVILDEAHYLNDLDRGVVWEEVLIYLPPRVRLLLLSATISNAEEVCEWLKEIRGIPNRVVFAGERPVPLETLFLFHDGLIVPLGGKRGLGPKVKKFVASKEGRSRKRARNIDFGSIISCLRKFDLLPAIFFLKSRSDCDRAILTCNSVDRSHKSKETLKEGVNSFLSRYPHLKGHRQMKALLEARVGSHHGGQLPYWKVLVEKMMNRGFLEAIFSTSTVAAGVNFPARTVVLVQSDRYNGHEFIDLTATDLHQMIGRAGRRGKDHIGFALVIPGLHQDPQLIHRLKDSSPEPILSQIHINFSMTLNLLLSHSPVEVKDLLDRSFAAFQEREAGGMIKNRWDQVLSDIKTTLPDARCNSEDPYEILENIRKRAQLKRQARLLKRVTGYNRMPDTCAKYLEPGRLFLHKNRNIYVAFGTSIDHGRLVCAARNIKEKDRSEKRRSRLKKVDLSQIKVIFDNQIDISEDSSSDSIERHINSIVFDDLKPLTTEISGQHPGSQTLETTMNEINSLPCEGCRHLAICHRPRKSKFRKTLEEFRSIAANKAKTGGGLWLSFRRHVRFLKQTGFVDEMERLTSDGYWASKLRLDQPLLIAEAIRKGALKDIAPEILAGILASFVWDKDQDVEMETKSVFSLTELENRFNAVLNNIEPIISLKKRYGFDPPSILFWPAAALFIWAKGFSWEKLMDLGSVDEGDMASLIMRTADHLRQIVNLKETHPTLASAAETAIEMVLRDPVYIF